MTNDRANAGRYKIPIALLILLLTGVLAVSALIDIKIAFGDMGQSVEHTYNSRIWRGRSAAYERVSGTQEYGEWITWTKMPYEWAGVGWLRNRTIAINRGIVVSSEAKTNSVTYKNGEALENSYRLFTSSNDYRECLSNHALYWDKPESSGSGYFETSANEHSNY